MENSLAQQGEEALPRATAAAAVIATTAPCTRPRSRASTAPIVHLQDGSTRLADEAYIRDCILNPRSITVAGYPPVMPAFSGQLGEDEVLKLIAYIKSLGRQEQIR